jgi:hypothetical protein
MQEQSVLRVLRILGVFLSRLRLEFVRNERLVTDDPSIVAGLDDIGLARSYLTAGSIFVSDVQMTSMDDAHMVHLTIVGPDDRLNALGPLPARLKSEPRCGCPSHLDDLDLRLLGRACFVRRIESPCLNPGHVSSSSSAYRYRYQVE